LIFEKAFIAEVQGIFLVGEHQERWRSDFRLRDVVDAYRARFRGSAALPIDFFLEPAI
jgi:hypothetical protein